MPYTLAKGLAWVLLAVLLGIIIGWLLRSVVARRQVERARSGRVDTSELERLRARVANLEAVVEERDRLRTELSSVRSARAGAPVPEAPSFAAVPAAVDDAVDAEASAAISGVADAPALGADDSTGAPGAGATESAGDADVSGASEVLDAAAAVLGRRVIADDLTVVEGIGPKIRELCHGIGITTWAELSTTEVSLLRTMLNDAGQRFKAHDPSTWPRQAGMLAAGDWNEFKAWTDDLHGGRAVD